MKCFLNLIMTDEGKVTCIFYNCRAVWLFKSDVKFDLILFHIFLFTAFTYDFKGFLKIIC